MTLFRLNKQEAAAAASQEETHGQLEENQRQIIQLVEEAKPEEAKLL